MTRKELLETAKPILFNTEMVRAILDGHKTVTRRVIKQKVVAGVLSSPARLENPNVPDKQFINCLCDAPYNVGDTLWVRETWYYESHMYEPSEGDTLYLYVYRADEPDYPVNVGAGEYGWKPSIHMPKEAARLFLRVTDVRVERLKDIITENICNEGVWVEPPPIVKGVPFPADFEKRTETEKEHWYQSTAQATYIGQCDHIAALHRAWENLWNSTIKPADLARYGWDANPWVWVIEFERVEVTP